MSKPTSTGRGLPARFRDLPRCPFFGWKIAHPNRASAVEHAAHLHRVNRATGRNGGKVSVRQCGICFAYHVGRRQKHARRG